MADTTQDNGPFTMVHHLLAQEVGLVSAAVYGEVRRRCQMQKGICDASLETLGETINLDRATVMRSIKKLCELGYLEDQTPGRRNAPHTYTLSKSVTERNSTSVVTRNSPSESVARNNSSTESVAGCNATVAESHLNRVLEESLQDSSPYGEGDKSPPPPEIVEPKLQRVEYTPFLRKFLAYFNAKRFRNPTQHDTVEALVEKHGETEVETVTVWAAKKGMGLGQAIPAIESALKNPKREKASKNGHISTGQNNTGADSALETTGPPSTAEQLAAAWLRKSRGGRDPT